MIDLYKLDGTLKPRAKLLYDFREVKVAEAKELWIEEQRIAYEVAYPSFEIVTDADLVETRVELEQDVTFDEYLAETHITQEAVEATETAEAIAEVKSLVREFVAPEIPESDFNEYTLEVYRELRAKEYPPMEDYLDAVVKGDAVAQQAYIDACNAVKLKYPKA